MEINLEMLLTVGTGLGVLAGGYGLGKAKMPFRKGGNGNGKHVHSDRLNKLEGLELSEETGGALHISKEGLSKIRELTKEVREEYMKLDTHALICAKEQSDMKLYISNTMGEHTAKILAAIKGVNGKQ